MAQETITITTSTNAPSQLTVGTGTTTIDVAAGELYTFNNLASGGNSAILVNTAGAVFRTTGSGTTVFLFNDISGRGPGLSLRTSGTLDLQNVRFGDRGDPTLGNTNRQSTNGGGALSVAGAGAVLNLINGEFYFNKTTLTGASGGAVEIAAGAISSITGAIFEGNSSANIAGALLYNSTGVFHTLASATFGVQGDPARGNTAASRGGAVTVYTGTVAMTNVAFYGNKVTSTNNNYGGGAVHVTSNGGLSIDGAVFEQNTANGGGALMVIGTGTTIITSATFGNAADLSRGNVSTLQRGGAILQSGGHVVLTDAAFYGNFSSTAGGGAIGVIGGGTLTINGGLFVSNSSGPTSGSQGSAIHLDTDAVATITSATFANNNSSSHATVLITGGNASLKTYAFTDSLFDSNYVASEGGAVFLNGGNSRYVFNNVRFTGNSANIGGAITTRANTWLTLNNSVFTGNTARGGTGGAISLHLGGLLEYNATVSATHSGNSAGSGAASGGFLYLGSSGTANINIAPGATIQIGGDSDTLDTISTGTYTNTVININNNPSAVDTAPGDGAGTLILANGDSSSQRGAINITAGRLLLANSATLGGIINVAAGATFGGQGTVDVVDGVNRLASISTGGTLQVGLDGADGASQTLAFAGTLALANSTAIIGDGIVSTPGTGRIILGTATGDTVTANIDAGKKVSIDGVVTGNGSLLKDGAGTLDLSGANTFAGGVAHTSGALLLGNDNALGTGTLTVTNSATVGFSANATLANAITLSTTTVIDSGAFTAALNGAITGPGGIIKEGSGMLTLGGASTGVPAIAINAGSLSGNINGISTISLANNAAYIGSLTRSDAQVLSVTTGSIGGSLTVSQGALLEFNLTDAGSGATLDISGAFTASGTTTLNFLNLGNDTYTIVSAGNIAADASNFKYTVNNSELTGRNSISAVFGSTDITITTSYRNLRMTWAGANGGIWDTTAENWSDATTSAYGETHFVSGDSIHFAPDSSGTVAVAPAGVTAGDIAVASTGDLTFAGGSITTNAASASVDGVAGSVSLGASGTVAATGKLVKKGAGMLTFENQANTFAGGLEIEEGTLAFNHAAQLGGASGTISFTGPSTLRANADILGTTGTLAGTIAIVGASGTLDTQAHTVESTAMLAGPGTLVKTGDGNLILRATDNSAFTAPAIVAAGSLILANGARLGSPLSIASGATAGGAGAFTSNVTVNNGTLIVGTPDATDASALSIAGALALTGSARVQIGIHAGGIADTLNVDGSITTANATNIVSLSFGIIDSGTYVLGNAAALATVQNLEVNGIRIDDSLRIVSELAASSGTLLYIYAADDSRYMEWTGASGTPNWNIGLANWQGYNGDTAGKTKFQDGDTVRFTGATSTSINVDTAVTVSDMIVDNTGTLKFTGASITTGTTTTGSLITNATGKLVKNGEGALVFENAANTFTKGIELNAGLLVVSNIAQLDTTGAGITIVSGTLSTLGNLALADTLTLADGAAALDTGANTVSLAGGIAGTGTLAKFGEGALTISAATSGANSLGAGAVTRIVDGAVILRDFSAADAAATTHTFILDGGWLDLSDTPGFNATTGAGANDWSNLHITGTGGAVIGSNDKITFRDGAILGSIGGATTAEQGIFVVINAGENGVVTFTESNNYAGRTLLQSGTLRITGDDQLGILSLNREVRVTGSGAALEITADSFISNRTLALEEDGIISVAGGVSGTWAGAITGAGKTLTKAGAGELVVANTGNAASLSYHVGEGVLEGSVQIFLEHAITLDASGTIAVNQAIDATFAPRISGAGSFEKRGAGVLTLTAALGNTGIVRVAAGTLKTSGSNQFAATSSLVVSHGATLDLRGTRQAAGSLLLDGTLLVSATVNSNLGVILASDYLKATNSVSGTGSISVLLAETVEDGYSPVNGSAPSSTILIESGSNSASFFVDITGGADDAIYGWDVINDGSNWLLSQTNLIPVIPAVTGINASVHIASQTAFDMLAQRVNMLRLANNGEHRAGNDWWIAGAYRHDKVKGTLYDGATATTGGVQAGVNLVKSGGKRGSRQKLATGVFVDLLDTRMSMNDADTNSKTGGGGVYVTYQPNAAFHAGGIARFAKGRHDIRVDNMDDMRLGTNGIGLSLSLGYTIQTRSGWLVDLSERLLYSTTNVEKAIDSAHRLYEVDNVDSLNGRVGVQFSRNVRVFDKWDLRPAFRMAYNHEFKGQGHTTVIRYFDADRTRLRDRYAYDDDFGGGSVEIGAGSALRFSTRFEAYADLSTRLGGKFEDYTANLGLSWHW